MNCTEYQKLTILEQIKLIGELVHVVQNSPLGFERAKGMIEEARHMGYLDNVVIMPNRLEEPETEK